MVLEQTLNAYFRGYQLTEEDLKRIVDYRSECINQAALSLGYLQRKFDITDAKDVKPGHLSKRFDELFESEEYASLFLEKIHGHRVIEIGPGFYPKAGMLFEKLGIAKYVAVEPINFKLTEAKLDMNNPRIKVIKEDGLSYLLHQPDDSAVIISCGVICPELLEYAADNPNISYFRFLGKEMQRVTPAGSLTIHETSLGSNQVNLVFIENGFKPCGSYDKNVFVKL